MTFTSLGDLAQGQLLRRTMATVKATMQRQTEESTTGVVSDIPRALGGDLGALHAIRSSLSRLDAYKTATAEMQVLATTMQSAVQSMADFVTDLATPLLSAGTFGQDSSLTAMAAQSEEKFLASVTLLNTRIGDRAIFGGTATDRAPLPDGGALLADLRGLVAAETTAAGVRDRLRDWFDDPAGFAARYAGSNDPISMAIAEGESAALGTTANDPALREMLLGMGMAAILNGDTPVLATAERAALATMAGSTLLEGTAARAGLTADLAVVENRVSQAQSRNSAEGTALELAQSALVAVDPYEAATRLTEAQTRLEAIYAITARLSSLSLANYLR